jgi:hypothetical protein
MHTMSDTEATIFLSFFPFFFIGMWLLVTTMLGFMSGWFSLQSQFPRSTETPLLTFRGLSARMGLGVNLNGILRLRACPSGMEVGIWRAFGPFQRPFLVPWAEISAERRTRFFMPMARLGLGSPEIGSLTIDAGIWQRLSAHAPRSARLDPSFPPVSNRALAQGLALQWAALMLLIGAFFAFATQLSRDFPLLPLLVFLSLPAIALGVTQIVRYARQRS